MKHIIPCAFCLLLLSACNTQHSSSTITDSQTLDDMNNPLLQSWDTPFATPPFDLISSSHYQPAIEAAMMEHEQEINNIVENPDLPTFENTIVALETSGESLKRVSSVFNAVEAANTDDVIKKASQSIRPQLAAHLDNINMNKDLFDRVHQVYQQINSLTLSSEDLKLLDETYKSFIRSGVNLEGAKQAKLRSINQRLATLSQNFDNNLLDETNAFDLHVTERKDLGQMPQNFITAAEEEARKRGHDSGWSFTLQRPSFYPFLDYSPNRNLRDKIFQAYAHRGNNNNASDNKTILEEIVKLRTERAHLLGYQTHADYVLEETMAENADNVYKLLDQVWKPALSTAIKDRILLAEAMRADGIEQPFRASDWRYYVRKIREQKYNFDEDQTRPYFEANAVRDGAFMLAEKLFGLSFVERKDISTWHDDQQVFEVFDESNQHLGILYTDFYARATKRGGAWMNELRSQSNVNSFVTPVVTNNFNFPAPTGDSPSLLSFTQAQTVFHEFGHALHGLLSKVKYASLSGTNVPRDFVEFPSQVMENWMSEPEILKLYAKHYQTGEVIPAEMVAKMNQANGFNEGFRTVEYMAAAYLDMDWHSLKDTMPRKTEEFEKSAMDRIGLIDAIIPRYRSTYFAHITGGYSAGYYSYLWSEILDADAYRAFKKTGDVLNPQLAQRFRMMLSSGGTKSGMDLYKGFKGSEPNIEALLMRKGFL